jgi:hypothetical protein
MNARAIGIAAAGFALVFVSASSLSAQDNDEPPAITARVHGTFVDARGGAGVLSGDMSIVRFEVRNETVTAVGRIEGALADSVGNLLGRVNEQLALPVGTIESTCNQLRMDLSDADADVLGVRVHFDRETAGFDSRQGTTPKALRELCAVADVLHGSPTPAARAEALNALAAAIRSPHAR